jgi:hypothetical protein
LFKQAVVPQEMSDYRLLSKEIAAPQEATNYGLSKNQQTTN